MRSTICLLLLAILEQMVPSIQAAPIDFSAATVVVRSGELPPAEKIASVILTEEIAKRARVHWTVVNHMAGSCANRHCPFGERIAIGRGKIASPFRPHRIPLSINRKDFAFASGTRRKQNPRRFLLQELTHAV